MPSDAWNSFGFVYGRSGVTRGTTTSSGVFVVNTGFARRAVSGFASDALTRFRNVDLTIGAQATFFNAQWITPSAAPNMSQARFRIRRITGTLGATATMRVTNATSTTGIVLNWQAFGY